MGKKFKWTDKSGFVMADFLKKNTEYDVELIKDNIPCTIKIGGQTEKFVPNINMSKWNDECFLNINHPDVVNDEKESFFGGNVDLKIGDQTHRYYVTDNDDLEYEIIYDKKPLSNIVTLNLSFSEGLNFLYQPALTQEEIDEGANRPENVQGSYAVYWRHKDNQYKTGKFCHIYRPKIHDSDNNEVWGELIYSNNQLLITIPQDFLDGAVYPVTLDPTFGYTTVGASSTGSNTLKWGTDALTPASSGNTQTWHVAIAAVGSPAGIKLGLYNTSGGNPNSQSLIEQVEFDVSVSNDESAAASGSAIAASTLYHLCFISENSSTTVKYDTGVSGDGTFKPGLTYATEMINPYDATGSNGDRLFSIWMDYGAATGSVINQLQKNNLGSDLFNGVLQ
jgi:hypothetical protein